MGNLEYTIGRVLAFIFITMMFFALYKYLPVRKVRTRTALLAALFSGVLFEAAKQVFRLVLRSMNPSTLYTGTIAALVIVVVWIYYAGMLLLTWHGFNDLPSGYIPSQDKGYLLVSVQLPDAASLERTIAVVEKGDQIVRRTPGVAHSVAISGQSILISIE